MIFSMEEKTVQHDDYCISGLSSVVLAETWTGTWLFFVLILSKLIMC